MGCFYKLKPPITVSDHEIDVAKEYRMIPQDTPIDEARRRLKLSKAWRRDINPIVPADFYEPDTRIEMFKDK